MAPCVRIVSYKTAVIVVIVAVVMVDIILLMVGITLLVVVRRCFQRFLIISIR